MKETDTNIENTADINRAKIRRFCGSIIIQAVVLSTVAYATIGANEFAQWGVMAYFTFICLGSLSFIIITLSKPETVARTVLKRTDNWRDTLSPSGTVRRYIGTFVTVIEVALLLTHGWIIVGTIWAAAELLQYLSVRKIAQAAALIENGEVEYTPSFEPDTNPAPSTGNLSLNDEFLTPEIDAKLTEIQTELNDLDTQIRRLLSHNDGALPPEGSLNRKDYNELSARRDEVIESIDTVILEAAKDFQQRS